MSHLPYCPNELSPWAHIRYIDETAAVNNLPQAGSESTENDKSSSSDRRSRTQRLTNARPKSFSRGRRTSFGSSQHYLGGEHNAKSKPLDRQTSGAEVERLLRLRRQKMEEAHRDGNELEVHRLQHLGLFDDIDITDHNEDVSDQAYHQATTRSVFDVDGSTSQPLLFTQGHTAELCSYMKTQEAHGVAIPTDFSICAMHPHPKETIASSPLLKANLNWPSLSSLRSSTTRASTSSNASTTDSSTWLDSDISSLHSSSPSKTNLISNQSSTTLPRDIDDDDDDPFLYIAKAIHNHNHNQNHNPTKPLSPSPSTTLPPSPSTTLPSFPTANPPTPPCPLCPNHPCRTYLTGKPSQHCLTCNLPTPQPEIQAAIYRISRNSAHSSSSSLREAAAISRISRNSAHSSSSSLHQASTAAESVEDDLRLVAMYDAEMEIRARDGVWWEGWLVVEALREKGFLGERGEF